LLRFHDNHFMFMNTHRVWAPRVTTFSAAALAAASMTYWVLKWSVSAELQLAPVTMVDDAPVDSQALVRLLGGASAVSVASASPSASSRFALLGVLAGGGSRGTALISVDGKPAKPYKVGGVVADNLVLQSVAARRAVLAAGANAAPELMLEMKPLPR
jgi:general secretion pathway protein C